MAPPRDTPTPAAPHAPSKEYADVTALREEFDRRIAAAALEIDALRAEPEEETDEDPADADRARARGHVAELLAEGVGLALRLLRGPR